MAVNETKIFLEGFLQKRKDRMRVRWATYWFRLQNATLFFYTKMNGNALNLRGNYYICTVQSVREVHKANSKRFMFEINMKNGKRKLLAAESAELRQRWVAHLWQAMHLSASWASTLRSTHQEACQPQQHPQESNGRESPPPRAVSAPADHAHCEIRSLPSPTSLPQAHICRTTPPASAAAVSAENHYDVLPVRRGCELRVEMESPYDIPSSNMSAAAHPGDTENIYDVPSALLRKISDRTLAQRRKSSGGSEAWKDGGFPEANLLPMP